MRKLDHGPAAPKIARPSIHPNPSSRFRRTSIAPPTDDSQITQHRIPTLKSDRLLAGVELLRKCQNGDITLQGIRNGRGESEKISREFSIESEFEPLSNAIYVKDQWQPETPWQKVNLYRDDVLALWPPDEATENRATKAPRKRDVEADAKQRIRIEKVLAKARTLWPDAKNRPGIKPMAGELVRNHRNNLDYKFGAVCKILDGTYPASRRRGIPGI